MAPAFQKVNKRSRYVTKSIVASDRPMGIVARVDLILKSFWRVGVDFRLVTLIATVLL